MLYILFMGLVASIVAGILRASGESKLNSVGGGMLWGVLLMLSVAVVVGALRAFIGG